MPPVTQCRCTAFGMLSGCSSRRLGAWPAVVLVSLLVLVADGSAVVKVFSVAPATSHPSWGLLQQTAAWAGSAVAALGGDAGAVDFAGHAEAGQGSHAHGRFGKKLLLMREAAQASDARTLLVFVDGYDTAFVRAADDAALWRAVEAAKKYAATISASARHSSGDPRAAPDIVTAADLSCWPDAAAAAVYPSHSAHQPFRFLNNGFVAGAASAFVALFAARPPTGDESSGQRYFVDALGAGMANFSLPWIDMDYRMHAVASVNAHSLRRLGVFCGGVTLHHPDQDDDEEWRTENLPKPLLLQLANDKPLVHTVARLVWGGPSGSAEGDSSAYVAHRGEFAQELQMALPLAHGAAVAGTLAATRGCGPVQSLYWYSPDHEDNPACLRAWDVPAEAQLRWSVSGGVGPDGSWGHVIGATPPEPPARWWLPPPLKARGLQTRLRVPPGAPDVDAFLRRNAVVLIFNKHNTEWEHAPVNTLDVGSLEALLDTLLARGCLPVYSRPTSFLDNSLDYPFGDKDMIRGRYAGRVLLLEDAIAANPQLDLNSLQMALFSRAAHAVSMQGGPAALAGYFVQPGGNVVVMHKKGFETVSGEYQLVYAHFNGGRYTVVRTEAALLAEVAAAANASNWCA